MEATAANKLTWHSTGTWVSGKANDLLALYHGPSKNYKSRDVGVAASAARSPGGSGAAAAASHVAAAVAVPAGVAAAASPPKCYLLCVHKPRSQHRSDVAVSSFNSPEVYREHHNLTSFKRGSLPAKQKKRTSKAPSFEQALKKFKVVFCDMSAEDKEAAIQELQELQAVHDPTRMQVVGHMPVAVAAAAAPAAPAPAPPPHVHPAAAAALWLVLLSITSCFSFISKVEEEM